MIGDLKIKVIKDPVTGEDCLPPDVMDIIKRWNAHRDLCSQCDVGWKSKTGLYCVTGQELIEELLKDPHVEYTNTRPG